MPMAGLEDLVLGDFLEFGETAACGAQGEAEHVKMVKWDSLTWKNKAAINFCFLSSLFFSPGRCHQL